MDCSTPGFPIHHQLPELAQTHVCRVDDAIQPSHPLSSPSPLAFNLSQHHGLCKWVISLHQWPNYWSFSFSISPSNEYSGQISFMMDWFDPLAVQRSFKSLLQRHSSKASILRRSAFFTVQLSHPYMTAGSVQLAKFSTVFVEIWLYLSSNIFGVIIFSKVVQASMCLKRLFWSSILREIRVFIPGGFSLIWYQ